MELFHDRRNTDHLPTSGDYDTPLTPHALAKANQRFRQSGVSKVVGTDPEAANAKVRELTRTRRKNKKMGQPDFGTVGEYLEFLNGMSTR